MTRWTYFTGHIDRNYEIQAWVRAMNRLDIPIYPNEVVSIEKYKKYFKDAIFFDIGAYKGIWSLMALKNGARFVVSFDPNIEDRVPAEYIHINQYARVTAFVTDELHPDKGITIDDFVEKESYEPTFMKIDVEGDEIEVLNGAKKTIKKYKPYILIESHDQRLNSIKRREEIENLLRPWVGDPTEIISHIDTHSLSYHIFYIVA